MKNKCWSDCKNWRIHKKIISTPNIIYWYDCKKVNFFIAKNSIINCFQFWTFCSNYITESSQKLFASFRFFYFVVCYWKLTSKSPASYTVIIYFSQPVTESLWKSHRKLSTFSQQAIDICRERHYKLSVFISCSKLLKVNNYVTRQVISICLLLARRLLTLNVFSSTLSTKVSSIHFSQKSYWKFTTSLHKNARKLFNTSIFTIY